MPPTLPKRLRLPILVALAAPALSLAQVVGVVTGVLDGDTVTITAEGHSFSLDLAGIEAPELDQPAAAEAKHSLSELCYGRSASIEHIEIDPHRHIVGHVECDGVDVNAEQVRRGFARVRDGTLGPDSAYYTDQAEARGAHRGLWATP